MGYFEARAAAQNLKRYFDLVKVFYRFIEPNERDVILKEYPQFAGDGTVNDNRSIKVELNRLSVRVYWALRRIDAPLDYTIEHTGTEYDIEKHKNVKTRRNAHVNIILDQFQPNFHKNINLFDAYEMLVNVMEKAIPLYESIRKSFWKRWINPIWLLAAVLRIPVSVLEYMGIDTSTHQTNKFVYWLIQSIMLIALALLCFRLGLPGMSLISLKP